MRYCNAPIPKTNLGEVAIPWEVEVGKIHVRESRVHVHVHIWSGGGGGSAAAAAVQVVLPVEERVTLVCLTSVCPHTTDTCSRLIC